MSTKHAGLKTDRTCKHGTPPGKVRVRVLEGSGLRKLMRAACRGKLPSERLVIINGTEGSAELRADKYLNSSIAKRWHS